MYELVEVIQKQRTTDAAALRHVPVGDANARRPAPWNAAGLVGDDPRHRRPCRRPSPASDRPPREQGTRGRARRAGRRTVGRTGWWEGPEGGPGGGQSYVE